MRAVRVPEPAEEKPEGLVAGAPGWAGARAPRDLRPSRAFSGEREPERVEKTRSWTLLSLPRAQRTRSSIAPRLGEGGQKRSPEIFPSRRSALSLSLRVPTRSSLAWPWSLRLINY